MCDGWGWKEEEGKDGADSRGLQDYKAAARGQEVQVKKLMGANK